MFLDLFSLHGTPTRNFDRPGYQLHFSTGMTEYYQRFIREYATIAELLTNLTRKEEPDTVNWTATIEHVFQTLKNKLTTATILKSPDYSKTFVLQTDTSQVCVGAVLSKGEDDYPIAYY